MYVRKLFFAFLLCIPMHVDAWQNSAMMGEFHAVQVPDFKGMTYKDVQARAIDSHTKRPLFANIKPLGPLDGVVATQSPEKGTPVQPGQSSLVVTFVPPEPSPLQNFLGQLARAAENNDAKKPTLRAVPDLFGKTLTVAEHMVDVANLRSEVNGNSNGTVTQQYPPPRTFVKPGTTVSITLGLSDSIVPGLYGMTLNQAAARLDQSSLRLGDVIGQQGTTAIVRSQNVQPGTHLPRNSSVGVALYSQSPPPPPTQSVPVPDLDKRTRDEAISDLNKAGLQPGAIGGPDAGLVESQSPTANTPVDQGSSVEFVLAIPQVVVPNLNKSTRAEAVAALTTVGLKPGSIAGPDGGLVNGQSQSPPAGTQVDTGTLVSFSLVMPQVVVPTLLQAPQKEAEDILGVYGLVPALTRTTDWNANASHIVVAQQPDAGISVDEGSSVAVIIGNVPPSPDWWDRLPFWKWFAALGTLSVLGWSVKKIIEKPFPPPAVPTLASHPVSPDIDIGNNGGPRVRFKITLHDRADAASYTMSKEPTLARKG